MNSFTYLGTTRKGSVSEEIKARIVKGDTSVGSLNTFQTSKLISRKAKMGACGKKTKNRMVKKVLYMKTAARRQSRSSTRCSASGLTQKRIRNDMEKNKKLKGQGWEERRM